MKKLFSLLFLITLALSSKGQFIQWANVQHGIKSGISGASGSSLVATAGTFSQSITFGSQTFNVAPGSNLSNGYLAVHDHAGNFRWAKHIVTPWHFLPVVTVDNNQNIIIAGTFNDSLYIDGLLFKASATQLTAQYVAKFSPTGTLLWARSSDLNMGSIFQAVVNQVTTDATGNIIIGGQFSGTLAINGVSITGSPTKYDSYLVKYSANGTLQWLRNLGFPGTYDLTNSVKTSRNGNIFISGSIDSIANTNSVKGMVLTKVDPAGTVQWRKITPINTQWVNMVIDEQENAYLTGFYYGNETIGNTTLTTPTDVSVFLAKTNAAGNWVWAKRASTYNHVVSPGMYINGAPTLYYGADHQLGLGYVEKLIKLDTAGVEQWQNNIPGSYLMYIDAISGDPEGNLFIAGRFTGTYTFGETTLTSTGTASGFLAKVTNEGNLVTGTVFMDVNHNGVLDTSEKTYDRAIIQAAGSPVYGISTDNGKYRTYLPAGNLTVSLANPPRYYAVVPASHTVTFSGINQAQHNKDFALQPVPNSNDVMVTLTNLTAARPGSTFKYRLTFQNNGTTTLSDTLKFTFNTANQSFVSASETPLTNAGGKMTWLYQNLEPHETRNIDLTFTVPTATVIGTNLITGAFIGPFSVDLFKPDNLVNSTLPVTGSFDPNDKQVSKPVFTTSEATNGEFLEYTIRFQNTGNDTAFTVVVTDKISQKLKLAEFEMLSASHHYKLDLLNGDLLEWRFNNILLPDSNRNEPASHGFIRFRIKSKPGLATTDSITNQAAIYFDYNAPVITNYAITRVFNPMGFEANKAEQKAFRLYPNPAENFVTIEADLKTETTATVTLLNIVGQTVKKVSLPAGNQIRYELPLENLPKGIYLVKLETETGMQTKRLVIH